MLARCASHRVSRRKSSQWHGLSKLLLLVLCLLLTLAPRPVAAQAGELLEISGAPLRIQVYPNGSLQVYHQRYTSGAAFGVAGSGFFLHVNSQGYGPFLALQPPRVDGHSGPLGSGAAGDPWRIVTQQSIAGEGLDLGLEQTISYVQGANFFDLSWQISNRSSAQVCFKAYHAADLYFADDDYGVGYYDARSGAVGGSTQARDWFMALIPSARADHYLEARYTDVWDQLQRGADLGDSVLSDYLDNGAALQWDRCLGAGDNLIIGDRWSFGESAAAVSSAAGGVGSGFRAIGPLAPPLTTYIPTPLDVSGEPEVILANLFLAALAMILFTAASEVLNRLLAENELFLQNLLRPVRWLAALSERLRGLKRPRWVDYAALLLLVLVYGLIFSFLEPSWQPFSLGGVWLFVSMCLAFGVVGLGDDLAQWWIARGWGLPAQIQVRPANLALALLSTLATRAFFITPGILLGMPEAFEIAEEQLDARRKHALLRLATAVLALTGVFFWLPSAVTAWLQTQALPVFVLGLLDGVQGFLLLVYAIAIQNLFVNLLDLPDTYGQALKRSNKLVWAVVFTLVTFIFYHTLVNPSGDLARALASTNVRLFFGTIGVFLVGVTLAWLFFRWLNRRAGAGAPAAIPQAAGPNRPPQAGTPFGVPGQPAAGAQPVHAFSRRALHQEAAAYTSSSPLQAALDQLIHTWRNSPDPAVRRAAAGKVAAFGEAALPALEACLGYPEPGVRQAAAAALSQLVSPAAAARLQVLQRDADPIVAGLAWQALNPAPPAPAQAPQPARRVPAWLLAVLLALAVLCLCLGVLAGSYLLQ